MIQVILGLKRDDFDIHLGERSPINNVEADRETS